MSRVQRIQRRVARCGHCQNLGLPSDHRLRETADQTSKLLCPVLLKTECRVCGEFGHTRSRCPMEQMRERLEKSARRDAHRRETALRADKVRTVAATVVQSSYGRGGACASNNKFADLDSEEDEEGDAVAVVTKLAKPTNVGRIFAVTGDYKKRSWADYSSDEE